MKYFVFIVLAGIGFTTLSNVQDSKADISNDAPIVLELFTSQSCSSCPPADRILTQLQEENSNIIALSCNVTYWNHLHWEDTLSKEFCSTRQRSYVRTLQSRGPYTPQIVINGEDTMVGSSHGKIIKSINQQAAIKTIGLTLDNKNLKISLPETPSNSVYAINLIIVGNSHTQSIPSGENRGRTVKYTNPVENIISLGTWDGTGKNMSYDVSNFTTNSKYVLLAQQNGRTGKIIAAGQINN